MRETLFVILISETKFDDFYQSEFSVDFIFIVIFKTFRPIKQKNKNKETNRNMSPGKNNHAPL